MKTKFLLSFFIISTIVNAQVYKNSEAASRIQGASYININSITQTPDNIKLAPEVSIKNSSAWLTKALSLAASQKIVLLKEEADNLGFICQRYQSFYKNTPIEGGVYLVHGKDGFIKQANGFFYKESNVSVTASLKEPEAFNKALSYFNAERYMWEEKNPIYSERPKGTLVILPLNNTYVLCHKFDIYSVKPNRREYVYVNAHSGLVVKTENRIHETDVEGTAETKYNGVKKIMTDSYNGSFRLRETARGTGNGVATYDLNNSTSYGSAVDFTDADNYWNTTTDQDNAAYDAHYGSEMVYDYYKTKFNRNSFDNAGAKLISYVHYDLGYVNAFWNGSYMTYGDGDGSAYTALTSMDIVGHEITHAVTERTAGLVYSYESGALNESFSDIFGVVIDFYSSPGTANYLMGDQISSTGTPFRSMSNPNQYGQPDTYKGTNWYTGSGDNGGVHYNSGVQNYWFYLLTNGGSGTNDIGNIFNVSGIGMDKAAQITYRTLTSYLTSNSQYADARTHSIQAAIDLFGACSAEEIAVTNAWYAVGVGASYNKSVLADFSANPNFSCTVPTTIQFIDSSLNATSYLWNFGDGSTSTLANPSHIYTSAGIYTVSLTGYSSEQCGSNSNTKTKANYIIINNQNSPIKIILDKKCLNYDSLMTGASRKDSVLLTNTGCDTLKVNSIVASPSVFTVNPSSGNFAPGKSGYIKVTFAPLAAASYTGTLTFHSNVNDTVVCLTGTGTPPPVISVNPTSFNVAINNCNDSLTYPLTINNTGGTNLNFNILNILPSIPPFCSPSDTGQNNTYGFGIYNVTFNTINNSTPGTDGRYKDYSATQKTAVQAGKSYTLSIQTGPNYPENVCVWIDYNNNGIFEGSEQVLVDQQTNNNMHTVAVTIPATAKSASLRMRIASDYSGLSIPGPCTNPVYGQTEDYTITNGNFVLLSASSGTVTPGSSTVVSVKFKSIGLISGQYTLNLLVNSNDPAHPQVVVPCTLNVAVSPKIALNKTCLNFDSLAASALLQDSVLITNTGCDILKVDSIVATPPVFTVDSASRNFAPGESGYIKVAFVPSAATSYTGTLTFYSNVNDTVVCLTGTGTPLTYVSSTTTQKDTSSAVLDRADQAIIGIEIVTSGNLSPLNVTSFTFNTTGSTNPSVDISSAKLYIGSSNIPDTLTQFGTASISPNGTFTISGTHALGGGTNYFWLAYDVPVTATVGNVLDAQCTSLIVGTVKTPTVIDPAGSRKIAISYCDAGSLVCDEYIENVTLGTINNSTSCSLKGYGDYSSVSTNVYKGVPLVISVTNGKTFYPEDQCGIWVDWNNNGDFSDDQAITVTGSPGVGPYTATITCPQNTLIGLKRIRVRIDCCSETTSPCGDSYYGEVEDYTINVKEVCVPTAICKNITVQLNALGNVSITAADVDGGSTDTCGTARLTINNSYFSCANLGSNNVVLTATDESSGASTCTATVTVEDKIAPVFTSCPGNITLTPVSNNCFQNYGWAKPTFTDNCSAVLSVSTSNNSVTVFDFGATQFASFPVGITTVTFTIADASGNTNTCSFTVTVKDDQKPAITGCPSNITVNNAQGLCSKEVSWNPPTASDNCSGVSVTATHIPGATFPVGTTTVSYTATDASGNTSICSFSVIVKDIEKPIIICPANIKIAANSNDCTPQVFWNAVKASDNCSVTVSSNYHSGDHFPAGTTVVTYTAVDPSGNSTSCSFNVKVIPYPLIGTIAGTNLLCNGYSNGKATVNVVGGCLPYTYVWSTSPVQTNASATSLSAGVYTVKVTDANGTSITPNITITQPALLVANAGANKTVYYGYSPNACATLNGTATGGVAPYKYVWSTGAVTASISVCPSTAKQYTLTVTDANGCTSKDVVKVCVVDVRASGGKVAVCHKNSNGTFSTLNVYPSLVPGHLAHGDKLGKCGTIIKCIDAGKTFEEEDNLVVEDEINLTSYPNPFFHETTIRFNTVETGQVEVAVYNVLGIKVASIFNGIVNGLEIHEEKFNADNLSNGIYFVKLITEQGDMRVERVVLNR